MKRILVTGADGFIGSHLTETLLQRGYTVRCFVQYNSFNSWGWLDTLPKNVTSSLEVVSGDVRDPFGVKKAMQGCEVVMHLAALIAIPYSYHSPASYVATNIQGSLNIVQAARECNIEKLIHTSTSEVYGTAKFVPITEEHPLQGQSPYSATKIAADQLVMSYYFSFDTPVAIIRPFNTYGPRQSARAVIPAIITQIASGKREIKLGSMHPTRDFNYVADTVDGFIRMIAAEEAVGEVINIGSNFEVSIGEVAKIIAGVMGVDITIITDDQRKRPEKSEVERLWADNSKAGKLLGWYPQHGGSEGFRDGIEKTVAWFLDKSNLQRYSAERYVL